MQDNGKFQKLNKVRERERMNLEVEMSFKLEICHLVHAVCLFFSPRKVLLCFGSVERC